VSCQQCPNSNCYDCANGGLSQITLKSGGLGIDVGVIGFTLPSETVQAPNRLDACSISLPAPLKPLGVDTVITLSSVSSPFWDEYSITANNAPAQGAVVGQITIPGNGAAPAAVDLTAACKAAAAKGAGFGVYLNINGANWIQFPSLQAGKPAVLSATIH